MEQGSLVKATYDFQADFEDELSLQIGDVIQISEQIDSQWLSGNCDGRTGRFPANFIIPIKVPDIQEGQELFAATSDFHASEPNDLQLEKGDLILGIEPVDANWWRGQVCNQKFRCMGIFPLTYVWRLDKSYFKSTQLQPTTVSLWGVAAMDLKSQLVDEVELVKGQPVHVTEIIDKDWYRGSCNGKSGTIPAVFVTLETSTSDPISTSMNETHLNNLSARTHEVKMPMDKNVQKSHHIQDNSLISVNQTADKPKLPGNHNALVDKYGESNGNHYGYDTLNSGITPYGRILTSFHADYPNELSVSVGQLVQLVRHIDNYWIEGEINGKSGLFPKKCVDIIVNCEDSQNGDNKNNSSAINEETFPPDTFGRVIFEFKSQIEGDLPLNVGDTITLLRRFNGNWYEAVNDNRQVGLCPANYIEVIGSNPEELQRPNLPRIELNSGLSSSPWILDAGCEQKTKVNDNVNVCLESQTKAGHSRNDSDSGISDLYSNSNRSSVLSNISKPEIQNVKSSSSYDDLGYKFGSLKGQSAPFSYTGGSAVNVLKFQAANDGRDPKTTSLDRNKTPKLATQMSLPHFSSNSSSSSYDSLPGAEVSQKPPLSRQSSLGSDKSVFPRRSAPPRPVASTSSANMSAPSTLTQEDIQSAIQEKEKEINKCERSADKLRFGLSGSSDPQSFSHRETLDQIKELEWLTRNLKDEVAMLKSQLKSTSRSSLSSLSEDQREREEQVQLRRRESELQKNQERRKKTLEQRQCIIMELLQTEKDYLEDMKVCHEIFLTNPDKGKALGVEMGTLFGNLDEVIDIAGKLLSRLQKCCRNVDPKDQAVGDCFVDLTEDLQEVYGLYCRNHDEVNPLLKKYESSPTIQDYLNKGLEEMKSRTNCFDLPSVLIKPVQRLLKYPLLLNELEKVTDESHVDKLPLQKAIAQMAGAATAINEFRRRKDLVFKYRNDADTSLSFRLSKLNLHSLIKKSTRFGARISSTFGLSSATKDDAFEQAEKRFHSIEKTLKIFLKDITAFVSQMQDMHRMGFQVTEDIAEFYQERKNQKEVDQLRSAHRIIFTQHWQDCSAAIEKRVVRVLKQLLEMFHGPQNLIQKRYDKLLDYDMSQSKYEKNKDNTKQKGLNDELLLAKHTYEALNTQLLDEVPRMCTLSVKILEDCIRAYLQARKIFIFRSASELLNVMDLPSLSGSEGDLLEQFKIKHRLVSDILARLSFAPKQLFPSSRGSSEFRKSSPKPNANSSKSRFSLGSADIRTEHLAPQSTNQRVFIQSHFPAPSVFQAIDSHTACDLLDLTLNKGDIVGVLKMEDPLGNKNRWFVDNGVAKGFVPAKLLTSISGAGVSPKSSSSTSSLNSSIASAPGYPSPRSMTSSPNTSSTSATSSASSLVANRSTSFSSSSELSNSKHAEIRRYSNLDASSRNLLDLSDEHIQRTSPRTASPNYTEVSEFDPCPLPPPIYNTVDYGSSQAATYESVIYSRKTSSPYGDTTAGDHRYEVIPDDEVIAELEEQFTNGRYENVPGDVDENEYFYAAYPFSATGPHQLTLVDGQVVLVQHKQDLHGNPEWWFVEDRYGNKGYVPRNYLAKYQ